MQTVTHVPRSGGLSSSADTFVQFLPMFHAFGLYIVGYFSSCIGARLVVMSRFLPERYLQLIQKYKVRHVN